MSKSLRFTTSTGRVVYLTGMHVRLFSEGYLEGKAKRIRKQVLKKLPEEIIKIFPGRAGLWISDCPGKSDEYPALIVICDFHCYEPVKENADCSGLITAWYVNDLIESLPEFISERIRQVDWEKHAVDGWY